MTPPMATSPRVERSKAVIIEATLALLAEEGVGGLTVDAVAARAGVGKATLYRHWSSRAELILEAISSLGTEDEAVDRGSLRGDLEAADDLVARNPAAARALADGARQGYVSGMHLALLVAAVVALVAAGLVLRFLPGKGEVGAAIMAGRPEHRPAPLEPETA